MTKAGKVMCAGTEFERRHELTLNRMLYKCTTCGRVSRTERRHQVPGKTTASHDKTMAILWEYRPRVSIPLDAVIDLTMRASTAGELAENRLDEHTNEEYVDPALLERVYADAVGETIAFMAGLAHATEGLVLVLRAGRAEGDDLPVDQPLGYPVIERAS